MPLFGLGLSSDRGSFGFRSEKEQIDTLITKYKPQIIDMANSGQLSLEYTLNCPLASSYFLKYMSTEYTAENLKCYFELQSLVDYLRYAEKKVVWKIETIDMHDGGDTDDTSDTLSLAGDSNGFFHRRSTSASSASFSAYSSASSSNYQVQSTLESREMIKRCIHFRMKFLDPSAPLEINLPGRVKQQSMEFLQQVEHASEQFDALQSDSERIESIRSFAESLRQTLMELRRELLINLKDPYQRFMSSDLFMECFALFLSSEGDDSFHRMRLLEANSKTNEIVLNQPVETSIRLQEMSHHLKELETVHPISLIRSILQYLLDQLCQRDLYVAATLSVTMKKGQQQMNKSNSSNSMNSGMGNVTNNGNGNNIMDNNGSNNNTMDNNNDGGELRIDLNYDLINEKYTSMWDEFIVKTFALANVNLSLIENSEEELLTFFINCYNCLLIHAVCSARSLPLLEISKVIFFTKTKYKIGGYLFSLNDIYEGILQGNTKSLLYGKRFKRGDQRRKFMIKNRSANIFFGLIDMTKYSPNLQIYDPQTVYTQLEKNTQLYFSRHSDIKVQDDMTFVFLPITLREKKTDLRAFHSGKASENLLESLLYENLSQDKMERGLSSKRYQFVYLANEESPPNFMCLFPVEVQRDFCEYFKLKWCRQGMDTHGAVLPVEMEKKKSLASWQPVQFKQREPSVVDRILFKKKDAKCSIQ